MPPPEMFDPNRRLSQRELALMGDLVPEGAREQEIQHQMGIAEELRKTGMPTMRGNSRIMVASNPLEFGATALWRIGGANMYQGQQGEMRGLADVIRRKVMGHASPGTNMGADQQELGF